MSRFRFKPRLEVLEDRTVPSTLHVGTGANEYHTINAALAAANSGDTIKVDAGKYNEQVVISTNANGDTLNNIKLLGANQKSIIDPTVSTSDAALVEVKGATGVTISGFTITGPGSGSGSIGSGIQVDSGASATISGDHVTNIRDQPISGDQNGRAILVYGSATISHNTIDNYQKGGIVVRDGGSADIHDNVVKGSPNNTAIPSNGIEFLSGATGSATNNIVAGNVYKGTDTGGQDPFEGGLPLAYDGVGILLFQSGVVKVSGNSVVNNDIGIWDFTGATGTSITHNVASFNTFDGIALEETGTNAPTVAQNVASNNGHDGIEFIFDTTGSESGTPDSLHNMNVAVTGNIIALNGNDGIQVEGGSTGNQFTSNIVLGNHHYDAEDASTTGTGTAGTGNTWQRNLGGTSSPDGLFTSFNLWMRGWWS